MAIVRDFMFLDDVDRGAGLKPLWFENATIVSSNVIAHDMLEHFPQQVGAAEGECEAFGALVLLRLQTGCATNVPPAKQLGFDICDLLRDAYIERTISLPRDLCTHRLSGEHASAEDLIQEAVWQGLEMFAGSDEGAAELREEGEQRVKRLRQALIGWIRRGYRRALKRYQERDIFSLGNYFFDKIGKEVERLMRSEILAQGDRVRISLNTRALQIGIRVNGQCAYAMGLL